MYNIKLESYIPEPRPATSDKIIAAHYYAAWKKGAPGIHNGFDDLHEYPERTPLMGYYDEENPAVCDWEIKWATEHGINCFIHCWYRKKDNMGKPVTVNDLRCGHGLHEALFNAKYQKYMKFAIMFENSTSWGTTDGVDIIENLMPFWMENYFKRENYLVLDNKPVLFVFRQSRLSEVFKNPEGQKSAFDACREYAKQHGFDGMIFGCCDYDTSIEGNKTRLARGYDFGFGYSAGYYPKVNYPGEEDTMKALPKLLENNLKADPMRYLATVSCFFDATPRTTKHWIDLGYEFHLQNYWHLSPENYRAVLKEINKIIEALPQDSWARKIVMIDNWNEWDEGHFVAPSHEFGFKYLQAIREEFTNCDNLPDYRMPQDMGLLNYNNSWEIFDFKEL